MAHLARSKAPKNWPIRRKGAKWITRPSCGAHPIDRSISTNLLLKSILNYAQTTKEVKYIINKKYLLINKCQVKDYKFPIGFMDVIDMPETKESYRIIINEKRDIELIPIKKELDSLKPSKIIGKTMIKGKKMQLNLSDSRNIIVEKDIYKVGDTIVLDLLNKSIVSHLKLEKGSEVFLSGGKHTGCMGKIKEIIEEKGMNKDRILVKTKGREFETLKDYAYVIDKKFLEK